MLETAISNPWGRSPRRMILLNRLALSIAQGAETTGYLFALLYVDLDRFRLVNDSLGYAAGNSLLALVGERLRGCLGTNDVIARLREDEFLILFDDMQQLTAGMRVVERVHEALRAPFKLGQSEVFVSASIGVALGPSGYSNPEEIVRDAESAMHRAKAKGPGGYDVFDIEIHKQAMHLLELEAELRRALDLHELRIQYESILSLEASRVVGFEALLRWMHPQRGLVSPGEFVPIAERTRLIIPITRWVLREACRQLKEWQTSFPAASTWLSVNLSPIYVENCDIGQEIGALITETGIDASSLNLEITENQFLENADRLLIALETLKHTGIRLWIDDFGTGYSSLGYLATFPVHSLKIDRSFIAKSCTDEKSAAIVKAILALGKNLGINVIAEGIETQQQLDFLRSVECPYGQGYLFARK